jgi:DNA-binding NtrC family response regulator
MSFETPVTVLFVDDDPLVLRSLSRAVGHAVAVWTASCAEEAIDILREQSVDVVVSDLDLPDMNGIELLGVIRREHPRAIRMMLTGAASLERAIGAINEGELHRFFIKPLDLQAFASAMHALGDRIASSRQESARERETSRRRAFFEWVDAGGRPPSVGRDGAGDIVIDDDLLEAALRAAGATEALALLGDE